MKISRRTQRKVLWGYSEFTVLSKQRFGPTGDWAEIFFFQQWGLSGVISLHTEEAVFHLWAQTGMITGLWLSVHHTEFQKNYFQNGGDRGSGFQPWLCCQWGLKWAMEPLGSMVILLAYPAWAGWYLSLKVQRITEITHFFPPLAHQYSQVPLSSPFGIF